MYPSYHHVSLGLMDAQTRVWVHLVCVGSSTVGVCRVCGHISMQLWVVICRWLGKHDGEVHALTKHAKLCLSSTPAKTGKAHKLSNLSRYARIVLKTSPGIAECERQKNKGPRFLNQVPTLICAQIGVCVQEFMQVQPSSRKNLLTGLLSQMACLRL